MDLLNTVRKEGSRGGTGDFKWEDVQNSSHREHYLGHSLHAPVGRWQKGRDLNWYARSAKDEDGSAEQAAKERAEEIRKVKEAEQDALAKALGLPVPDRSNPNTEVLGDRNKLEKLVTEGADYDGGGGNKGVGFGGSAQTLDGATKNQIERIEGSVEEQDKELQYALKEYRRRHGEPTRRSRSRSHSRERDRRKRHRRHRSRSRSRSRDNEHRRRRRSRSREHNKRKLPNSRDNEDQRHRGNRRNERSHSPRSRDYDRSRHDRRSGGRQ